MLSVHLVAAISRHFLRHSSVSRWGDGFCGHIGLSQLIVDSPLHNNLKLFSFEPVPVFLLDEREQSTTIFRFCLEPITAHRVSAEKHCTRNFGGDIRFRFDVIKSMFHNEILRGFTL